MVRSANQRRVWFFNSKIREVPGSLPIKKRWFAERTTTIAATVAVKNQSPALTLHLRPFKISNDPSTQEHLIHSPPTPKEFTNEIWHEHAFVDI